MFRIVIPLVLLAIQVMLYRRVHLWLREALPQRRDLFLVATLLFGVFNAALIYTAIVRPRLVDFPEWFLYSGVYPFFFWHGATFFIGLVLLVMSVVKLPVSVLMWISRRVPVSRRRLEALRENETFRRFDATRRTFLRRSVYGLTGLSFGGTAYGMIYGKTAHEITEAEFSIPLLPSELDGLTIVLASDIHSSIFMTKEDMDGYVKAMNGVGADVAVVVGDFVNSMTDEVYPFAEAFSALSAPLGVYGVMGNHDFFAPQPELVAREIDDCGVKLLRNDLVVIEKNGGRLYLGGIDDVGRSRTALEKMDITFRQASLAIPKLLLCHRPYFLGQAAEKNIDLVLSGHTHGGQVVLGRFGETVIAPAALASPYVWGKYRVANTEMYVSRGIGTVGLPIRVNCPPEITKITLRKNPRADSPATRS